ncbi:ABC transporter permease [Acidobacteriota bacterium]
MNIHSRDSHPPRLGEALLKILLNQRTNPAAFGDLAEEYAETVETSGVTAARIWYWRLVLISIPSFMKFALIGSLVMLKNHITIAFRNIKRHKAFTFINIAGLALGLASSLLIVMFLRHELGFDRHNVNFDRIYRVGSQFGPTPEEKGAFTADPMAPTLKEEFPEVEYAARFNPWPHNYLVRVGEKKILEEGIRYADGDFLNIFSFNFIYGDPRTALTEPFTIIITESIARKYFGSENPLGKTLRIEDRGEDYKITGIVEDCVPNSHFQFEMIASMASRQRSLRSTWMSSSYFTYLLLKKGTDPSQLESKFPSFVKKFWGAEYLNETGQSIDIYLEDEGNYFGYFLQPLEDIHFGIGVIDGQSIMRNPVHLVVLGVISIFILLIACINFMNLSTARFSRRAKEVGIRKMMGSNRSQLIRQFLSESVLFSWLSLCLSLVLAAVFLPVFNNLADIKLDFLSFFTFPIPIILLLVSLAVGIIAGLYPAFYLSSLPSLRAVKGMSKQGRGGHLLLRRSLVFIQFSITFITLFGMVVITRQLNYVTNSTLGFEKEKILVVHRTYAIRPQADVFKQKLLMLSDILNVSHTETLPGRHYDPNGHRLEEWPSTDERTIFTMYADYDLADLLDLKIVEGRYFSKEIPTDATSAVVINETAAKKYGIENPVGKRFHKEFGGAKEGDFVTIIGVVKDFHFQSLHQKIEPMIIRPLSPREWYFTAVKVRSPDIQEAVSRVEGIWNELSGGQPFVFSFLDSDFEKLYLKEQKAGSIFTLFTFLALCITGLGLFGLVSFIVEQQTKEIGIKKILGASVLKIFLWITREVVLLELLSIFVAAPLALYFMQKWLQNFAFRIHLDVLLVVSIALLSIVFALIMILYKALTAALANPIDALRYE